MEAVKAMRRVKNSRKLKICLACSIGGHFTQMLELKEVYERYEHFFVTNLGRQTISALKGEKKYFIPDRKAQWANNLSTAMSIFLKQLFVSLIALYKENPDVIISTGAGDVFWILLIGKLLGKKIIFIESLSRVTTPSRSGRVIYMFANLFLYHWANLRAYYPKGIFVNSFFPLSKHINKGDNKYSYFVTVGTIPNDFSRLLTKIDELIEHGIIEGKVFVQKGYSKYLPENCEYTDFLDINEFEKQVKESNIIISHGGVGTLMTALKYGKKVIVVPRYRKFKEIKDDHQLEITRELEREGKIVALYDIDDMEKAIRKVKGLGETVMETGNTINKILIDWLERQYERSEKSLLP